MRGQPFTQHQNETASAIRTTPAIEWYYHSEPTAERLAQLSLDGVPLRAWPVEDGYTTGDRTRDLSIRPAAALLLS